MDLYLLSFANLLNFTIGGARTRITSSLNRVHEPILLRRLPEAGIEPASTDSQTGIRPLNYLG